MRIQLKFFLAFSLLTSIPLLILLFGVVDKIEDELVSRTEKELHATLTKMSDELLIILTNQKSVVTGLARIPVIKHFSHTAAAQEDIQKEFYQSRADQLENFFLNYQLAVTSIQALRYLDKTGKTLVKVKEGKPVEPALSDIESKRLFVADQSKRSFVKTALGSKSPVTMSDFELGQVVPGADFCPAMVRYSVPIKDEIDQLEGILVVNMWGTRLDSTIQAALGGYPGKAYLIEASNDKSRDGIYLYHENNQKRFGNQLDSKIKFTDEITQAEWDLMRFTKESGSLYRDNGSMYFFRVLSPYPKRNTKWLITIKTTNDVVLAPVEAMRSSIIWLLVILLVCSLIVAVWAALQFAKPVQRLASLLTRYADGEHEARYTELRNDEIGFAGEAFNYLAASLEKTEHERDKAERAANQAERLASLGQLAAGISHEINNPLMNINSLAELVETAVRGKDDQAYSDVQLLQKEVHRCARIVQGILNFARKSEPHFKEFDIAELITETLTLLEHRIQTAELKMVTQINSPLMLRGDSNLLQQVLVNILLNAVQASPTGSNLFVTASAVNENIDIEILDSGAGIEEKDVNKIFDPFFTTKQEGEGTGLGLSVSYGIIKRHGGTITIENSAHSGVDHGETKGVRVSIILPIKGPKVEQADNQKKELQGNTKNNDEEISYVN